ncbi:MAG: CHAD domain-containing protein [Chlorobium sp.]|jgi:CHAD domain-containing protein|uniref:CHAD domain-containing protein n=1 Tax=Chlorobium sp. TaxID=1095 RepID=UPI0025C35158|nr:CHAD domain-containing protein [Chlorobium sp.]MCF8217155.1 CHAD domain-containing protein [Chlorobium sp.]MCF8272000.1 CHAD domain-containing protein [Chlorobium sp.]MCF8288373.1 CHAD domain-containing protein [Chlorobium sp.]MCF8291962.1 CHAD domain-containing protein [Chlorobium sp.]MCF8386072.1 CHAD domain-containing protein [Chlorobium sp.]
MTAERKNITFRLPEDIDTESLLRHDLLQVKPGITSERKCRRVYYDTFEWQLLAKGLTAIWQNKRFALIDLDSGLEVESTSTSVPPKQLLAASLPAGAFRERLGQFIGVRALLKRCVVEIKTVSVRILDAEEKTIGFLAREATFIVKGRSTKERIAESVIIQPLKGFGDEAEALAIHLEGLLGKESKTGFRDIYIQTLMTAEVPVNDYTSKIRIALKPEDPVRKSASELLLSALNIMRQNEPWIPCNIDTEFLHDYRVAIRRTRSVLSLVRGIFDAETTDRYRKAFRNAGQACNALRDCDVYLLGEEDYRAMLPDSLAGYIGSFFEEMHAVHSCELRRFSSFLRTKAYREMLDAWERLLRYAAENPSLEINDDSAECATLCIAKKNIRKAWKKIIRHGRDIPAEASDAELHSLRIDCKKLRYLLELFASLFPEKTMSPIIRHLKGLQENLGTFVDMAVQQRYLSDYLASMKEKPSDPQLAAALGGLITTLYNRQEKTRKLFNRAFRQFDNDETEKLFNEILNS